ncbi:VOC family protein [Xanthomonas bundabergensis]|uniref:VOC family protein n=1 Tax=Xanthomonas bundabergensis TaxID=3160842 RepID=UPI003510D44F
MSRGTNAMPCCRLLAIVVLGVALAPAGLHAQPKGRVTGVGGIFVKSDHPKALMAWYRDVLGIQIEPWGGAMLSYDAPGHPPVLTLNAFARDSDYMAPSAREFMLNFAVDDLDAILQKVEASGVAVLKRDDDDPSGKFAWIVDPDGTKIELWQPKAESSP